MFGYISNAVGRRVSYDLVPCIIAACIHMYIYICIPLHITYINICVDICVCVYMCTYIYIYIYIFIYKCIYI